MAKLSRSAFFSVLVSSSAFVLAGCGGGTEKNSNYTGSYRSAYSIPTLGETGVFSFTVDTKGKLSGTLDNQNGQVREVSGSVKGDGSFEGGTLVRTASGTGRTGVVSGTVSAAIANNLPGNFNLATPVTGGSFALVEGGSASPGSFQVQEIPITLPSPTPPPTTSISAYQGYYSGIYNVPELNQNGNTSFSVDAAGAMTGLLTRNEETGTLTGTLTNGGNFTGSVAFRQEPTTVALNGTLVQTADRSTLGNFTLTQRSVAYAGTFGATTVVSGTSPYIGSYRGTYSIPEGGEDGAISFTVDPAGSISGFLARNNNSPVGTFSGAFNNNGSFAGAVTYDASTGLAPRPITGRVGTSTISNERAGDFVMTINGVARPGNFEASTASANPDSNYRASYTSGSLSGINVSFGGIPSNIAVDSDENSFSVDKQGSFIGTFGDYPVTGRITNDARITGTFVGANGKTYPFRGIINKLNFTSLIRVSAEVPASVGPPPTAAIPARFEERTRPGISADLIFSVEGRDYNGLLQSLGGDGTTRKR